jgi:hypothetical protein
VAVRATSAGSGSRAASSLPLRVRLAADTFAQTPQVLTAHHIQQQGGVLVCMIGHNQLGPEVWLRCVTLNA